MWYMEYSLENAFHYKTHHDGSITYRKKGQQANYLNLKRKQALAIRNIKDFYKTKNSASYNLILDNCHNYAWHVFR